MAEQDLKRKTARGLLWGGLNNGLQQLLNLIIGIFLARLLTPADYGMVAMLSIFSLVASTLQESGFTAALVNRKDATREDFSAAFWFSTLMGVGLYVVLFFCAPLIAAFYHQPALVPLSRYVFLSFVLASLGTAQNAWLFKQLKVRERAVCQLTALALSGLVGIGMALMGCAYWGIATQSIVYVGVNTALMWRMSSFRPLRRINLRPLRGMVAFSSRILLTNIALHINYNLITVILGRFYNERSVGFFNQANKWNYMGYAVINGMVTGVAQPTLAGVSGDVERQQRVFRKMLRFTAFVSFPALLGLSLVARELVVIAITSKWLESVMLLRVLCVGSAFTAIGSLYAQLMVSRGRSGLFLWNTVAQGAVQLGAMLLCVPYGIDVMVVCYVCINAAWLFVWQYFVWREIGLTLWHALLDVVPYAVIAAGIMAFTAWATSGIASLYWRFPAKVVLAAGLYVLIMWLSGSATFKETLGYLRKKNSPL